MCFTEQHWAHWYISCVLAILFIDNNWFVVQDESDRPFNRNPSTNILTRHWYTMAILDVHHCIRLLLYLCALSLHTARHTECVPHSVFKRSAEHFARFMMWVHVCLGNYVTHNDVLIDPLPTLPYSAIIGRLRCIFRNSSSCWSTSSCSSQTRHSTLAPSELMPCMLLQTRGRAQTWTCINWWQQQLEEMGLHNIWDECATRFS